MNAQFQPITTLPLETTFMPQLDNLLPQLTAVFQKKGGVLGQKLVKHMQILQEVNVCVCNVLYEFHIQSFMYTLNVPVYYHMKPHLSSEAAWIMCKVQEAFLQCLTVLSSVANRSVWMYEANARKEVSLNKQKLKQCFHRTHSYHT